MFSIDGLVSGLDTSSIIEGLLSIQQGQLDRFNFRKQEIQLKQAAFQGIEANLLSLQSSLKQLTSFTNNIFAVNQVTSSNETVLQASASESANPGTFQFRVTQLARAEQIASQAYASTESLISQGTISFSVGNGPTVDVEISNENNTVQGLVDAVNNASQDISASVVSDGGGVRILLTSAHSGAANTINIANGLSPKGPGQVTPDFTGPAVQSAADSVIQLGSGTGAITIQNPTNVVEDVIPGVTLNLVNEDPDELVTLSIDRDVQPAREAIQGFVETYNNVLAYIDEQTQYEQETEVAGLLLGHSATNNIREQLQSTIARVVPNLNSAANRLSAVGIRFNDQGRLDIDTAQLDRALNGDDPDVTLADIRRLFALDGQSDDPNISFVLGSEQTKASSTPYEVNITQAASRASVTGSSVAPSIVIDDTNNDFSIFVDGNDSGSLTLTNGVYTPTELSQHLQEVINQSTQLTGPRSRRDNRWDLHQYRIADVRHA